MSRYWDPNWARPSAILTGEFDADALAASGPQLEAMLPEAFRDFAPCPDQRGHTRHGLAGPDYTVLVPASLRRQTADLQRRIGRLTWYFVCTRPRVRAVPDECYIADRHLHVGFSVKLDDGSEQLLTAVAPEPTNAESVSVEPGGAGLILQASGSREMPASAAVLAQATVAPDPYEPSALDLEVRYIGRARGELATRCALDRLDEHKQYQAVLEELQAPPFEHREVLLLLCSGTTVNITTMDDHPPTASEMSDEYLEVERTRERLTEAVRVDAVEALLINAFKPAYNTHYVGELDSRWQPLEECRKAGLTGLSLVMATDDLRCGLFTDTQAPSQYFHSTVCF